MVRLTICRGCDGGDALAGAVAEEIPGVAVARAGCLSVCTRPATLAAQAEGRATYVFGGLGVADLGDLAAFLDAYDAAPAGWIEDARPLGRLRFCLVTRVPAIS